MGPLLPLIVSALPAVGSWISGMFNSSQNTVQSNLDRAQANANIDKQNAANKALQDSAFAQNKDMWVENNRYNSPTEQMARLKAAGLNPNLVYGNGAVGNSSGSIPQYQAPASSYDYKAPDIRTPMPDIIGSMQDFQLRQAQTDNVKAQTEATRVRTSNDMIQGKFLNSTLEDRVVGQHIAKNSANYKRQILGTQAAMAPQMARYQLDAHALDAKRAGLTTDKIFQDMLFRKYQNEWMREGVTTSDNPLLRILSRHVGGDVNSALKKARTFVEGNFAKYQR